MKRTNMNRRDYNLHVDIDPVSVINRSVTL